MAYRKYTENDIYMMEKRTREISGNPYMLFTAYLMSSIENVIENDDEDKDEDEEPKGIFGELVRVTTLKRITKDCVDDFKEAAENGDTVEIYGKPYSIRKARNIDFGRLADTLKINDGEFMKITKDMFMDVSETVGGDTRLAFQDNKRYADRIVEVADEMKDGWDLLTDVEVLVYCWCKYCKKREDKETITRKDFDDFARRYKDYFYISEKQFLGCLQGDKQWPVTPYSFSAEKIRRLNKSLGQDSII